MTVRPVTGEPVSGALPEDLLALTARLVDIASPSRDEGPFVAWLEENLTRLGHLEVERVGDNLVARTRVGHARRIILAGHTDTVPAVGNERARIEGDRLWGVGATDMKGGLAVMLALARSLPATAVDVTYVFYAREEIAAHESGLGELFDERPDLLVGDLALLGEPTGGDLEAGCQGTLRAELTLRGRRAHTARPWMGRNAVHRLGDALRRVETAPVRCPVIDGLEFREALQAVAVQGGVAGNVVPDEAVLTLNHRFAPDRSPEQAEAFVREVFDGLLEPEDHFTVVDVAPAAPPGLRDPLVAALVGRADLTVRAKLGWTDVARFTAHGVPAANFGPGEPTVAHTAGEYLDREPLERCFAVLRAMLTQGLD